MSIKNIIIVCVLFFVMCIMLPMWAIGTKNHAISLEESVTNSYSDINVQEKRRVDLIYNLADIAKKYAKHEKETFEAITNARSSKSSDVENAALSIQAVQEAYNYTQYIDTVKFTSNKRYVYNATPLEFMGTLKSYVSTNKLSNNTFYVNKKHDVVIKSVETDDTTILVFAALIWLFGLVIIFASICVIEDWIEN